MGSVVVSEHFGVLEELTLTGALLEFRAFDEVVRLALDFMAARLRVVYDTEKVRFSTSVRRRETRVDLPEPDGAEMM